MGIAFAGEIYSSIIPTTNFNIANFPKKEKRFLQDLPSGYLLVFGTRYF